MSPLGEEDGKRNTSEVKEESLTGEEGGSFILFIRKDPSRPFVSACIVHIGQPLPTYLIFFLSNIALFPFETCTCTCKKKKKRKKRQSAAKWSLEIRTRSK